MAEGAKGTASDVYILDTGAAGADRLRLLDQAYGPFSRQLLRQAGLGPGKRVADLACGVGTVSCWMAGQVGPTGSVVAVDINPDQLVVAKGYWSECENLQPIEFLEASVYETGLASDQFDIVHCRLILCHLVQPENALREMYRILKPGGVLVSQELWLSAVSCHPESAAYTRSIAVTFETGRRLGVNYDYGMALPAAVIDSGFQLGVVQIEHPAYLDGPKKRIWEYSFAEVIPVSARTCGIQQSELLDLVAEMHSFADDKATLIAQWAHIGVIARKPHTSD